MRTDSSPFPPMAPVGFPTMHKTLEGNGLGLWTPAFAPE